MIKSKSQAKKVYSLYKEGKINYPDMMKMVHKSGDISKLPERKISKKEIAGAI